MTMMGARACQEVRKGLQSYRRCAILLLRLVATGAYNSLSPSLRFLVAIVIAVEVDGLQPPTALFRGFQLSRL